MAETLLRVGWKTGMGWRIFGSGNGGRRQTFLKILSASPTHWTRYSLSRPPPPNPHGHWTQGSVPGSGGLGHWSSHSPAS